MFYLSQFGEDGIETTWERQISYDFVGTSGRDLAHTSCCALASPHGRKKGNIQVQGHGEAISRLFQAQVDQSPASGTVPTEMGLGGHEISSESASIVVLLPIPSRVR
jgi:hypothetical protein